MILLILEDLAQLFIKRRMYMRIEKLKIISNNAFMRLLESERIMKKLILNTI